MELIINYFIDSLFSDQVTYKIDELNIAAMTVSHDCIVFKLFPRCGETGQIFRDRDVLVSNEKNSRRDETETASDRSVLNVSGRILAILRYYMKLNYFSFAISRKSSRGSCTIWGRLSLLHFSAKKIAQNPPIFAIFAHQKRNFETAFLETLFSRRDLDET